MPLTIFYDHQDEAEWARSLDPQLKKANEEPLGLASNPPAISRLVRYDRPDVVIAADGEPLLVLERSVEVPSGHNVGQRFGRIVSAAEERVPMVYFFPFAAYKHGGETRGPRYVNLRLFDALNRVETVHDSLVQGVNWPVDTNYEVLHDGREIAVMRPIIRELLARRGAAPRDLRLLATIINARAMVDDELKRKATTNPEYLAPPRSVEVGVPSAHWLPPGVLARLPKRDTACVYHIGMKYVRADPYTGMLMFYDYLYARTGRTRNDRSMHLIAHMPAIDEATWMTAVPKARKDVQIFKTVPDAIVLRDCVIAIPRAGSAAA